jgi:hypothetical protein
LDRCLIVVKMRDWLRVNYGVYGIKSEKIARKGKGKSGQNKSNNQSVEAGIARTFYNG